jgi:hypothetical protein
MNLFKRVKHFRKGTEEVELAPFSEPVTIFVNQVVSLDVKNGAPVANVKLTPREIRSLKEAVEVNKLVIRSVSRKLNPKIGDIIAILDDDPTDVYKQVLFGLVKRGKI